MRSLALVCAALGFAAVAGSALAQSSAPATLSPRPRAEAVEKTPPEKEKNAPAAQPSAREKPPENAPGQKAKGADSGSPSQQSTITEIYADQAVFDSTKSIGVFTGNVIVTDPRFNVQGEKLTIFISKDQSEGLDKAVVEGNVAVLRERPDPSGGPPTRTVSRSEKAVYTAKNGGFELTGNPRVQQGMNTHVATSPDTVMILNEAGQLQTKGPSRTEIRQPPKTEPSPTP